MDKEKVYDLVLRSALTVILPFAVICMMLFTYVYNDFVGER